MRNEARAEVLRKLLELSDEDRSIVVWEILGHPVRPWTEAQDVAALLGILQCPEGHQDEFSHFFVDGCTRLVVEKGGKKIPANELWSKQEHFDVPHPESGLELDGLHCEKCSREMKIGAGFYVPPDILKSLLFTGD